MILILFRHPYTAIAATEEIITLTIEDPYGRKKLSECDCLQILTDGSPEKDISDWLSRALYALNHEDVHELCSKIIKGAASGLDVPLERTVTSGRSVFANLANSLRGK